MDRGLCQSVHKGDSSRRGMLFGTLLAAAAVLQLVETVRATGWRARWPHLALAVIYATGAAIMLIDPVDASVALTLVLAVLLLAVGVLRVITGRGA